MDLTLSDEQAMLRDMVERFVADRYDLDKRRAYLAEPGGFSAENWATFAELGLIAMPFGEDAGGLSGGPAELMVVMEALGRGNVAEPYLAAIVLPQALLDRPDTRSAHAETIAAIAGGERRAAAALAEPQGRYNPANIETAAVKDGSGYRLTGRKTPVLGGVGAELYLVSARTAGAARDEAGISLFVVPSTADGLEIQAFPTVDGAQAAGLTLTDVRLPAEALIGAEGEALPDIRRGLDIAAFAAAADAVGAMQRLFDVTREYMKTRVQFGRPLAALQAVRHRIADMFIECEQCKSAVMAAAASSYEAEDWPQTIAAVKRRVAKGADFLANQSVQLHGGIGVTDEYEVSHYFKRLTALKALLGADLPETRRAG